MMKILSSVALASLVIGCGNQNSDAAKSESDVLDTFAPNDMPPISVLKKNNCDNNIGYKRLINFLIGD